MKYIDADKLKAEIERLYEEHISREYRDEAALVLEKLEDFLDSLPEQPVEGLEEAANEFANQDCVTFISRKKGFIAGAEWQREQMMDEWLKDRDGCFWDGVEEGKKAMREQMMKDAVEGVVCYGSKGAYIETDFLREYDTDVYGNSGDKVRVIVIKEDK